MNPVQGAKSFRAAFTGLSRSKEGARYHLMGRGNRGAEVFAAPRDKEIYLDTLAEAVERTGWRVHAWVLMRTHYHLLIETPEANLVDGME